MYQCYRVCLNQFSFINIVHTVCLGKAKWSRDTGLPSFLPIMKSDVLRCLEQPGQSQPPSAYDSLVMDGALSYTAGQPAEILFMNNRTGYYFLLRGVTDAEWKREQWRAQESSRQLDGVAS